MRIVHKDNHTSDAREKACLMKVRSSLLGQGGREIQSFRWNLLALPQILVLSSPLMTRTCEMQYGLFSTWLSQPVRTYSAAGYRRDALDSVRWLLIFGNVEDFNGLTEFSPISSMGSISLTTLNPFTEPSVGISLDPLNGRERADLIGLLTKSKAF